MSNFNAFKHKIDIIGERGVGERYSRTIREFRKDCGERVTIREDLLRSNKIPFPFPSLNQEDYRNWILILPKPPEDGEKTNFIPIAIGDTNEYIVCIYSKHDMHLRAVGILKEKYGLKKDDNEEFKFHYVKKNGGYKVTLDERYDWVEFKTEDEDKKYFTNSKCLSMDCSYEGRKGSNPLADIAVNPSSLRTLIRVMHSISPAEISRPKLGDYMNTLSLLTGEAIRFRTIEYLFIKQLNSTMGVPNFGNDNCTLIHEWGDYSQLLLQGIPLDSTRLREARKHVAICLYHDINKVI